VDCVEESLCGIDKSLNFRVDVDVHRPLQRGVKTIVEGTTIWIQLKYVKLPDFCYACASWGIVIRTVKSLWMGWGKMICNMRVGYERHL